MQPGAQAGLQFFPEAASTMAGKVDALYFYIVAVSVFFTVGIVLVAIMLAVKYRRRPENMVATQIHGNLPLEIIWSVIPLGLVTVMFFWGAKLFNEQEMAPKNSMDILVTGKKWMWKFQHANGKREINVLHIPVNKPVRLTMGSEDVIHDLFVPAFRVKHDVMPGRLSNVWFEATKTGSFHLFCNQYCGTEHSRMVGKVIVMEQNAYQAWLGGDTGESPVKSGEKLFTSLGCATCHLSNNAGRGPVLVGIAGKSIELLGGAKVVADDKYLYESITEPAAKIVTGYQPIMPTFKGLATEEQVLQLVAYVKSLKADSTAGPAPAEAGKSAPVTADSPTTTAATATPAPGGAQ
ncbi:MAG: cytochrome c oxidase subunit II [Candidatus Sumerlaeaceae bacterium]|nr:cytochrome c oxidase subunit II [Candidatus Sumerlaeaceae bacterium]